MLPQAVRAAVIEFDFEAGLFEARWLDTGMDEGCDPGLTPAIPDRVQVLVEIAEDDVAVAVHQRRQRPRSGYRGWQGIGGCG